MREKTAQLRRQHILEAAVRVFATRGFHRATIRDIAVEAQVADGTIYNVFESKAALLQGLLDPLNEAEAPSPVQESQSRADVRGILHAMLQRRWASYTPQTLDILRVVLSEVLVDEELRGTYLEGVIAPALGLPESLFDTLIAEGHIRPVDVPLFLRALTGSLLGLVMLRLVGEGTTTSRWDELPAQIVDLFVDGLLPTERGGAGHGAA